MRHRRDHRKLSRTASHRRAMLRNQVTSLFEHERIETTVAKAKESRRLAERLITYAKRNTLHSRRLVAQYVRGTDVVKKVFDDIAPLYATREGGYTRLLRTRRRLGDGGDLAILELVKTPEQKAAERRAKEEAKETTKKPKRLGFFGRRKKEDSHEGEGEGKARADVSKPSKAKTPRVKESKAKVSKGKSRQKKG